MAADEKVGIETANVWTRVGQRPASGTCRKLLRFITTVKAILLSQVLTLVYFQRPHFLISIKSQVTPGASAAAIDGLVDAAAAGGIAGLLHHPTGSSGSGATANINQVAAEAHLLRGLLGDCLRLQQFDADCDVTKRYIETNMTSALEQNHLDPTGLNAKVQQHRKFEEELFSRQNRVQVLVK